MQNSIGWAFRERDNEWGDTNSAATKNPLAGSKMSLEDLLAREAIQNSVDAVRRGAVKPRIVFRFIRIEGARAADCKSIFFGSLEMTQRRSLGALQESDLDSLMDPQAPLDILAIEDYETTGAFGNPKRPGSHLGKLMLELGDPSKNSSTGSTGGSFGYGKSVYLISGSNNVFFAYTRFNPTEDGSQDSPGAYSRFLGVGYHNAHEHLGIQWSGKAVFGEIDRPGHWVPIEDDLADELASHLGITRTEDSEIGTTIIVPNPRVDPTKLKESIELWWWPRLVSHQLDVEILAPNHGNLCPRPHQNLHLKKYISAFQMTQTEVAGNRRNDQEVHDLKLGSTTLGKLGLILNLEEDDEGDSGDIDQQHGEIALMRDPLMVVEYHDVRRLSDTCKGVFVADHGINNVLRSSENPAHTHWDANSERIKTEEERRIVATVPKEVSAKAREFSRRAQPPVTPAGFSVPALDKIVSRLIQVPGRTSVGIGGKAQSVSITGIEINRKSGIDGLAVTGSFRVKLKEDAVDDAGSATLMVDCVPRQDQGDSTGARIPVRLRLPAERSWRESGPVTLKLQRGRSVKVLFESEPYSSEWTVAVSPHVQYFRKTTKE